jgi:hypothetical protein
MLFVVQYGSLIIKKEHRLRVSENGVRRIFGLKRDKVMGEWRELRYEELHYYTLCHI